MTTTTVTNEGLPLIKHTVEGGLAVRMTNKTGVASVKGSLVRASAGTDNAFDDAPASSDEAIGVVYETGIADAAECWIVVAGIADVLLKDTTASTRGFWVGMSDVEGRADATGANPPAALPAFGTSIGHALESQGQGSDVICKCILQFN